jgi:hypothetical protein
MAESPYSEVPVGTAPSAPSAGRPMPEAVARALVIPQAPLAVTADEAIDLLNERVRIGESIKRPRLFRASTASNGNILRWHEDNAGIIEGMFEEETGLGIPLGRPFNSTELRDLLDSEIRQLSALRGRIGVRVRRPVPSAAPSSDHADPATSATVEEQSADFSTRTGAEKTTEPSATSAPQELPDAEFPSGEAADALSPFDELPDVASRPLDKAGSRSIAIATAASAMLPAYDADAASTRDFIGIDAVADAFS